MNNWLTSVPAVSSGNFMTRNYTARQQHNRVALPAGDDAGTLAVDGSTDDGPTAEAFDMQTRYTPDGEPEI